MVFAFWCAMQISNTALIKKTDKIKKNKKKIKHKENKRKKCIIQQKKLTPSKLTEPQKPIPEKAKITKTTYCTILLKFYFMQ